MTVCNVLFMIHNIWQNLWTWNNY